MTPKRNAEPEDSPLAGYQCSRGIECAQYGHTEGLIPLRWAHETFEKDHAAVCSGTLFQLVRVKVAKP